jgi:hypothetical protein
MGDVFAMLVVPPDQPIALGQRIGRPPPFEQIRAINPLQEMTTLRYGDRFGMRQQYPHLNTFAVWVAPQKRKRIRMSGIEEQLDFGSEGGRMHPV